MWSVILIFFIFISPWTIFKPHKPLLLPTVRILMTVVKALTKLPNLQRWIAATALGGHKPPTMVKYTFVKKN